MFCRIVCRSVTKGRLNVAECLVRMLCRFMVQTMVTETDEKAAKNSKKKLMFFFLVTFFKTRTGSREKFCEYVGADGFMRLIRADGS